MAKRFNYNHCSTSYFIEALGAMGTEDYAVQSESEGFHILIPCTRNSEENYFSVSSIEPYCKIK